MSTFDRSLSKTFAVVAKTPPNRKPGAGRTFRPGANALRRMRIGTLIREYRHTVVTRQRVGNTRTDWNAMARELERRNLPESANQVRKQHADTADIAEAAVMAGVALGVLATAQEEKWSEDRELDHLEAVMNEQASEHGADETDAELARETTALSKAEHLADLEEVGADDDTVQAASMGNIDDPQAAIDQLAAEQTEDEPAVDEQVEEAAAEDAAAL